MTIYNLKTDGDQYRITKFDNDLNVESSYLCTEAECECPAGHRHTCRHRQMLPIMLNNGLADTAGFYDFDNKQVLIPKGEDMVETEEEDEDEIGRQIEAESNSVVSEALPEGGLTVSTFVELPPDADVAEEFGRLLHPSQAADEAQSTPASDPHPTIGHVKRRI